MSQKDPVINRRRLFAGAGVAGAAAAAAVVLKPAVPAQPVPSAATDEDRAGGYRVTEHVLRYYRTTRV
jgi:hypothetical protein